MSDTELKCAKCDSSKIIPQAELETRTIGKEGELIVYTAKRPDAAFLHLQQREHSGLAARVCGECGYTELYTFRFEELYTAYLEGEAHRLPS
jgi:predicted nucleic-acid-binding Zn-ribbon protein